MSTRNLTFEFFCRDEGPIMVASQIDDNQSSAPIFTQLILYVSKAKRLLVDSKGQLFFQLLSQSGESNTIVTNEKHWDLHMLFLLLRHGWFCPLARFSMRRGGDLTYVWLSCCWYWRLQ